jgi:5-methylcytosine-specific restriction protein A
MLTKEAFRKELRALLGTAELRGALSLDVNAGELHRRLGGYPGLQHRMPMCCDAMYDEQRASDACLLSPPKGKGASLTIRYSLPR